jgi:uncharacterized cupin superfamily protein
MFHECEHPDFEYYAKYLIAPGVPDFKGALYVIPPGKKNYPYHWHTSNQEAYYIIKGTGELRTPKGWQKVGPGDFVTFAAGEEGAHQMRNPDEKEDLVYFDIDTKNDLDVCVYPDSHKVGVWGKKINRIFDFNQTKEYYDDE